MTDGLNILLIEDNPDDRLLIRRSLEGHFPALNVIEVNTLSEFELAKDSGGFDLVILDYRLGWEDGILLTQKMKAAQPEIPVVMFTVTGSEEVAVRAMKAGLDDYILKSPSQFKLLPDIVESILERHQQRRALAEAEARYRNLFNRMPVGLFRGTLEGESLEANQTLIDLLGYPDRETFMNTPIYKLYADFRNNRRVAETLMKEGGIQNMELQLRRYDGTPIWVNLNVRLILDAQTNSQFAEGAVEDITSRRQMIDALQRSELLNKNIIESVHEGVAVYDQELRIIAWNPIMEFVTGQQARELLGKSALEVFPTPEQARLLRHVLAGETVRSSDIPYYLASSGKTGWLQFIYSPLVGSNGDVLGVVATAHDITDRKQTEAERERVLAAEQQRTRHLAALNTATSTISASLDLDEILEIYTEQLRKLLNVAYCSISEWDRGDNTVRMLVQSRHDGKDTDSVWYTPFPLDFWPLTKKVLTESIAIQSTLEDKDILPTTKEYLTTSGISSILLLPLISKEETIGMVEIEDTGPVRQFTEQEIILAKSLTSQAAAAIENARLFANTRRQVEELSLLQVLSTFAAAAEDEDELVEHFTSLLNQAFYSDNFGVLLLDEQAFELVSHPSYRSELDLTNRRVKMGEGVSGQVALTGEPIRIGDVEQLNNYLKVDPKTRSELCIPLKVGNRVIGVVNAESYLPHAFKEDDERLLLTLAGQISVGIERIRANRAQLKRTRQLSLLNALGQEMTGVLKIKELCEIITKRLVTDFNYLNACALFVDEEAQEFVVEAIAGAYTNYVKPGEYRQSVEKGLFGRAYRTGLVQIVNDTTRDEDYFDLQKDVILSELVAPLMIEGKLIGILAINSDHYNAFDASEVSTLTTLADQLSVAIGKALLFEEEKEQRQRAETLREIAASLSISTNQEEILTLILDQLNKVINFDSASVMLLSGEEVTICAVGGAIPKSVIGFHFNASENKLAQPIMMEKRSLLVPDVRNHPDWAQFPGSEKVISWIGVPLISRGKCIGLLTIDGHSEGQFDQYDIEIATTFASHAANALENARLFAEITEALNREQLLNTITHHLTEEIEQVDVLDEIVKMACESVGAEAGSIGLVLEDGDTMEFPYVFNPLRENYTRILPRGEGVAWQIVESGKPVLLQTYGSHEGALEHEEAARARSLIGVPIWSGEKVIGALGVYTLKSNCNFTERDLHTVESIGRQAGIAIQNARLFGETRSALEREQRLNEIARIISSALDEQTLFEDLARLATELVGGDVANVLILDPRDKSPTRFYFHNLPDDFEMIIPDRSKGLMWQSIDEQKTVIIDDYQNVENGLPNWKKVGVHALIGTPIIAGDTVIGTLGVFSRRMDKRFIERDLSVLQSVARQAGIAYQNTILFMETSQALEREQLLNRVTRLISSVQNRGELIEQVGEQTVELVGGDVASISLVVEDYQESGEEGLETYFHNKPDEVNFGNISRGEQKGLVWEIIDKQQSFLIDDYLNHPSALDEWKKVGVHGLIAVPIIAGDRSLGALGIFSINPEKRFTERDLALVQSIGRQTGVALNNIGLYEELEEAYVQTVLALANAMDVRDSYTGNHSYRIAILAEEVGRALGCNNEELENIRWASLLHDIGKIGVPDEILKKPEELTPEEYKAIQRHPALGASIVAPVKKLRHVAPIIRGHQEWFDGSGYPDGLKGEAIPQAARILTVVDAYIAITDERVYRVSRTHDEAIEEIIRFEGTQFDPKVVKAFLKVIEDQNEMKKSLS